MAQAFVTTPSPHMLDQDSIARIMYSVLLALVPAAVCAVVFFGLHALWLMIVTVGTACATEAVVQAIRRQTVSVADGSAAITGLLLAFNLPPGFPLTYAAIGAIIAIVLGKQLFGGLGQNPLNPALVGRVVLAASFPVQMTAWQPLGGLMADAVSTATPLALLDAHAPVSLVNLIIGNVLGCIGETSVLAIVGGGVYLIWRQIIDWRIPVAYLGTVAALSGLMGLDPVRQICAGGLMLGAFFMATDMVTRPVTPAGRWLFGLGAGVIVAAIRLFGALPEGVSYSILIMNALTPVINKVTRPRYFGEVGTRA